MKRFSFLSLVTVICLFSALAVVSAAPKPAYIKKTNRLDSLLAMLKAAGLPTLEGKWHYLGRFDNVYPPEKEIDLQKTYPTLDGDAGWKEFKNFKVGAINDLKFFKHNDNACIYLYHEIEVADAVELPIALGSDDGLKVWLNGTKLIEDNVIRAAAPDQDHATLKLKAGKNQLLVKITQAAGEWSFYVRPELPLAWPKEIRAQLDKDFPLAGGGGTPTSEIKAEAVHYKIVTVPTPAEAVLEVGGLAFRPDGKLLACTRRGDVWLISNPDLEDPEKVRFKKFATGLHEALGLVVDGKDV